MKTASEHVIAVNESTFDAEVLASPVPVLVDFSAAWCPPCRALDPIVTKLAEERKGELRVAMVDLDACPNLAIRYGVRGAPTLIYFVGGKETARQLGLTTPKKLREMVTS